MATATHLCFSIPISISPVLSRKAASFVTPNFQTTQSRIYCNVNPLGDFGARDPFPAEIESQFGEKVLGFASTEHKILIPTASALSLAQQECTPISPSQTPLSEFEAKQLLLKSVIVILTEYPLMELHWAGGNSEVLDLCFLTLEEVSKVENLTKRVLFLSLVFLAEKVVVLVVVLAEICSLSLDLVVGWKLANDDGVLKLQCTWKLRDFECGVELINRIGKVVEGTGHLPTLHQLEQSNQVHAELWTPSIGGLSVNDFIVAAKIDQVKTSDLIPRKRVWA
ncbi:putative metacaspase-1-like [Capsicum annuum]|nr:putative metacaspase-1-like [Capsicum annuum]